MAVPPDLTELLTAWSDGDRVALDRLMPLVEGNLRLLAHRQLRGERARPLQTTELISEAYLRVVDIKRVRWQDRAHFLSLCATVMRRVLVDLARARRSQKRGPDAQAQPLEDAPAHEPARREDLVAIDEALDELAAQDARKARVVELRFFGGLLHEARALFVSCSMPGYARAVSELLALQAS